MESIMKFLIAFIILAALPADADAQRDVTRRSYTFLENRLVVAVHAEAPGELQLVRGQPGRLEVAARSRDGFAGFGLGGDITRQLHLTAVGSETVHYLVVVPEHVVVRVQLPDGATRSVPSRQGISRYSWGSTNPDDGWERTPADAIISDMLPTTAGGLFIVHSGDRTPAVLDLPDLTSVRSVSIRVQGERFSIAASRPLVLEPGSADRIEVRVAGEPLDLVVYTPRRTTSFQLRSGSQRLAAVRNGRTEGYCGGAVHQRPTEDQDWLTLFPREGRLSCR
jgi:hypothetical protein